MCFLKNAGKNDEIELGIEVFIPQNVKKRRKLWT